MARWHSRDDFGLAVGTIVSIVGDREARGATEPAIITLHARGERGQSVLLRAFVVEILEERPQPTPPRGLPPAWVLCDAQGGPP